MTEELFSQVHAALLGRPNGRGWYDADCPFCGKPAKRGQNHFGYSKRSYRCFVCGASGPLVRLAAHLRLVDDAYVSKAAPVAPPPREEEPRPVARWRLNPDRLLAQYRSHPRRFDAWRRYKALSDETIVRHDFGLGKLPFRREDGSWYMSRQEWLIVPLYEDGQLVGLRGRNLGGFGPKWISATGSSYTLWGVDQVKAGSVVWLCENYVDAAWLMQEYPEWSAVAIGGATTWRAEWADRLAARRPELVVVALDNDLAGAARGETLRRLQQEWIQERGTRPPRPNGPRIANSLRRAGVNALLFRWPEEAPVKAGLDWILAQRQKAAA